MIEDIRIHLGEVMKIIFRSFVYVLILTFSSFSQSVTIKIIETTDSHGAIFPYDFMNARPNNHSLAQVHTYVENLRKDSNQAVVLFSNGDILQGTPAVYYYNYEKSDKPHLYAEVMNYMKYDAGSIGNHDIETGHDVYDRFVTELNFPWLSANSINLSTDQPYFKPYTIIKKNGIKIAVLGMTTPAIPNWLPPKIWEGMRFDDMIETANLWLPIIKEKENPDIMIGLFHSGYDYTYNNQNAETSKNENATKLVAERVPGFDIVFSGHDHQTGNRFIKNNEGHDVLVIGGSSSARTFAEVSVVMKFNNEKEIWEKEISGNLIESKDYEPNAEFLEKFDPQFEEVKSYVSKKIGVFSESISSRESLFGDSPFVDLIHSIQLDISDADISFAAPLTFSTQIEEGNIYVKDMFKLYKYENLLYTMKLSGQEVKDILEYSTGKWYNQMKDENDNLLRFRKNDNGELVWSDRSNAPMLEERFYNFESAAGIVYTVDVSKPLGERISIESMSDGSIFDRSKFYTVALNSYRGNGGGGHLTSGAKIPNDEISSRIITSTEKDLRFYMMKWIEKKGKVDPKADGNWEIIPEDWAKKGKEKDYTLLFNN